MTTRSYGPLSVVEEAAGHVGFSRRVVVRVLKGRDEWGAAMNVDFAYDPFEAAGFLHDEFDRITREWEPAEGDTTYAFLVGFLDTFAPSRRPARPLLPDWA